MYCVIPLAGPDFYNPSYGIKPLYSIDGEPMIKKAITSRYWYNTGELRNENIIFVMRETEQTKEVVTYLQKEFAGCRFVTISDLSQGALLSALAGMALIKDYTKPIVVDLVDILYESNFSPVNLFKDDYDLFGILPYFISDSEKYSYLDIVDTYVKQVAEKRVISNNASAGTYFFRNLSAYIMAVQDSICFDKIYSFKNNLFLSPSFNGIIKNGKKVLAVPVANEVPVSKMFH